MTNPRSRPRSRPRRATPPGAGTTRAPTDAEVLVAPVPIVAIGASAGGLEALESFFQQVPTACGLAFVVVQHLDPDHQGHLVELLQRSTTLRVRQAADGVAVEPDTVDVIPPNRDLSILHGVLHLLDPVAPRGQRLAIDYFFRSLADDAEERAIGVVLSGMGTDGTLGLAAIKGRGGAAFVQDPLTARFDAMPRSAVEAGLADVIAPAAALPERILAYLRHARRLAPADPSPQTHPTSAYEKVVILLRTHTGQDFSLYKKNTVQRRIERRMSIHQIDTLDGYVRLLQQSPQELDLLFRELLIGVTSFFRDPPAWEQLQTQVLPALWQSRPPGQPVRAWVAGCATGEEAYSLAIAFREAASQASDGRQPTLQIFATDLDREAITRARTGLYPANIEADVSPQRLNRFFVRGERGYQVSSAIREMVVFAPHNALMDPPFTRLDLICCRNLMIYLTPELQNKLLPLFHFSLNPGGVLFLGNSETAGASGDLFVPLPGPGRLYRRHEFALRSEPVAFPALPRSAVPRTLAARAVAPTPTSLQAQAEQLILREYAPPAVLVNDRGDILYVSGRTGAFLEPAAGKANWNVLAMAREALRADLIAAFRQALSGGQPVQRRVSPRNARKSPSVEILVHPVTEPHPLRGLVLIVFRETSPADRGADVPKGRTTATAATLERALRQARLDLQTVRAEMQSSQEEVRSTNEELQSANEELQSTNEELTTSREEMQSMNEELQTLNHEMQAKVDSLSRLNNDLRNLLDSTELATVFLDTALRVRLFTVGAVRIFRLIPSDVGRPFTDIASDLEYPALPEHVREVLQTLAPRSAVMAARDGRHYAVRITPYRTQDNIVDGAVLTLADITASATLEAQLRGTQERLERQLATQQRQLDQAAGHPPGAGPPRGVPGPQRRDGM